jgi:hypothetical protein
VKRVADGSCCLPGRSKSGGFQDFVFESPLVPSVRSSKDEKELEMHDVANSQVRRTLRAAFSRSRFVLFVLALAAAVGLVALGRWTAPTTTTVARTVNVAVAQEPCGTIAPTTMPSAACQRVLESIYLGVRSSEPCGTIAPTTMPSAGCQRLLERMYLGSGR